MNAQSLTVLLVAEDRSLLRGLTRFLDGFGYHTRQAVDVPRALAAIESEQPDFLVVDSDKETLRRLQQCGAISNADDAEHLYTFLLVASPQSEEITEALEAGVDDFLGKPLAYGELLTRLRAGARFLEWERRLRSQSAVDVRTRLASRSALASLLKYEMKHAAGRYVACVLLDLDYFQRVNRQYGRAAGDSALADVATELEKMCGQHSSTLACLGADRFGVLLPGFSAEKASAWAERVRQELADREFPFDNTVLRFTASFGVAASNEDVGSYELLDRASEALRYAKNSGRDCVVQDGQFAGETSAWAELAAPGRLFHNTLTRDLMTPFAHTLHLEEPWQSARELLEQSRLEMLPVSDAQGKLAGVVWEAQAASDQLSPSGAKVRDVMDTCPKTFDEHSSFADLLEYFTCQEASVVIVDDDRPTGFVTADDLSSLGTPLTRESFATDSPATDASEYLLV